MRALGRKISGSDSIIDPYVDNLLAAGAALLSGDEQCDKYQVSLSGQNYAWTGLIFAPGGLVEWSGSDNVTLTGSLPGYSVRLNGSSITIIADPMFPDAGEGAQLIE